MMTARMMEVLKTAGIAKEWHKGDVHRLYIDLTKADEMYYDNSETANFEHARLILNRYERNNGKLWVELDSGEIRTKSIVSSEEVINQIVELVAFLTHEETEKTEETTVYEEAVTKESDCCTEKKEEEKTKESNRKASAKYYSEHIKRLPVNLNDRTDQDIIQHLQCVDNVQGYIKGLIRADAAKERTK